MPDKIGLSDGEEMAARADGDDYSDSPEIQRMGDAIGALGG